MADEKDLRDETEEEVKQTSGQDIEEGQENQETEETSAEAENEAEKGDEKDPRDAQIADLKDRLMRQMAEFDNYRKRTEKEKKQNYEIGASDFILKVLPVVDNFERGLEALDEAEREGSFAKGIDLIYRQLLKVLEDEGVTPIECVGKPFDPVYHNAVTMQPSDTYESGTVMQEFQKGYMYKERVLRHSMVIVAQ
jgi:molecular chaperone GrpE